MFARHKGDGATARLVEVEHTADLELAITAETLADLFAGAALGFANAVAGGGRSAAETPRTLDVESDDLEALLVDWLNALVTENESDGFLPSSLRVTVAPPAKLTAEMEGATGVEPDLHVKAATYHNLSVERTGDLWRATVVLDV